MYKRPILSKTTNVSDFKNYYWDKKELITFCRQNKIPAEGGKIDLVERIEFFLSSGGKIHKPRKKTHRSFYDSDQNITMNTPVIHYKNDAKTRDFLFLKLVIPLNLIFICVPLRNKKIMETLLMVT